VGVGSGNERTSTLWFKLNFGDDFGLVPGNDGEEASVKSLGLGDIYPADLITIILGCVAVTAILIAGMVLIWRWRRASGRRGTNE
jgi:hypothetical protein